MLCVGRTALHWLSISQRQAQLLTTTGVLHTHFLWRNLCQANTAYHVGINGQQNLFQRKTCRLLGTKSFGSFYVLMPFCKHCWRWMVHCYKVFAISLPHSWKFARWTPGVHNVYTRSVQLLHSTLTSCQAICAKALPYVNHSWDFARSLHMVYTRMW